MKVIKNYLEMLNEAGFTAYPRGWTRDSVKKFANTIAKSMKKGGPKSKGFFNTCVKKVKGKVENPYGFCAAVKDEVYSSTRWRGKKRTPAQIAKSVKQHKRIPEKPKGT